jgi:hypothetical protein
MGVVTTVSDFFEEDSGFLHPTIRIIESRYNKWIEVEFMNIYFLKCKVVPSN